MPSSSLGTATAAGPAVAPVGPMLAAQTRAEFLKLLRSPIFSIFALALPVMFYLFFGASHAREVQEGVNVGAYVMASLSAYAVANVMLFTFGIGLAVERGRKYDVLMRATPMRPWVQLVAKLASGLVFTLVALILLFAVAYMSGVRMDPVRWLQLTWRLLLGSVPFLMIGFAIGYLVSPNAAPAVVNLVALPMYFASGLFIPVSQLPDIIQRIAPYLPAYRLGQLAWDAVGVPSKDSIAVDALWLVGYAVAFLFITLWAVRIDESKKFS